MKTIDTLHEWCNFLGDDPCDGCAKQLHLMASEIEAEIERDYMRLPVDADGVPIHVGDKLFNKNKPTDVYKVTAIADNGYIRIYHDTAHIHSSQCRHVKPRTLENIVADAIQYGHNGITGDRIEGKVAEFCDEIRELLGGDV